MRKWLCFAFAVMLFVSWTGSSNASAADDGSWLVTDVVMHGAVRIQYEGMDQAKTKLQIVKGERSYTYSLTPGKQEQFPLQMGNGDYTIRVLEQVSGNRYKIVGEDTVKLELEDQTALFLNSVQNVNWSEARETVAMANALTKDLASAEEKVRAIYEFIINHITYDEELALRVPDGYIPQIDRTLAEGKGICYGYASLFAAMLRSVDVPAKLVKGSSEHVGVYHAWNEVYWDGQWRTIDTTVDAGWKAGGAAFSMVKEASDYSAVKYY